MSCEIIAEISGNHMGDFDKARDLIIAAAEAGCTGVKFQCFEPERLAEKRAKHPRLKSMKHEELQTLYRQIHTPKLWFQRLIATAVTRGLTWHASVFDPEDVDFLETLDCPRYKIASFEARDDELCFRISKTRKPVILSANQDENVHPPNREWLVLHATNYGVTADKANLYKLRYWAMDKLKFPNIHWPWGLSDHTLSADASIIAVVLGAKMIEWHIKLAHTIPADDNFSWEPETIGLHVRGIRMIERCLYGSD